jgi:uronate dehydrogenase
MTHSASFQIDDPAFVAVELHTAERTALVEIADRIGLDHPDIHFEIFYGASNNERGWWDNHRAIDLGYRPTGRAEDFREHAFAEQAKLKPDPVGDFYQGGSFCGMEFDGDKSRIIDLK